MVLWNENKSRTFAPTNKDKTTELLTYLKKNDYEETITNIISSIADFRT